MQVQPYLEVSLLLLVTVAAITDLAERRIPNRLLLAGWIWALALHALSPTPAEALADGLLGASVGLLVFLPLYLLRGMAAGDVKLMATAGAFIGPAPAFAVAILSWCAGGVMALLIILWRRRLGQTVANLRRLLQPLLLRWSGVPVDTAATSFGSVGNMPYGLAIATGTLVYLVTR